MDSRERVMTALNLKELDRVPFMDFVDTIVKLFVGQYRSG